MSHYICPNCQHKTFIFGENGARRVSQDMDVEILGTESTFENDTVAILRVLET